MATQWPDVAEGAEQQAATRPAELGHRGALLFGPDALAVRQAGRVTPSGSRPRSSATRSSTPPPGSFAELARPETALLEPFLERLLPPGAAPPPGARMISYLRLAFPSPGLFQPALPAPGDPAAP